MGCVFGVVFFMDASESACRHGGNLWDDYGAVYDVAPIQLHDWHSDMFVVRWPVHVASSEAYRFPSTLDSVFKKMGSSWFCFANCPNQGIIVLVGRV